MGAFGCPHFAKVRSNHESAWIGMCPLLQKIRLQFPRSQVPSKYLGCFVQSAGCAFSHRLYQISPALKRRRTLLLPQMSAQT